MAERYALLVIDMLVDFVRDDGALPVPDAKKIIPCIRERIDQARRDDAPVIYVCDSHRTDDAEFKRFPPHAIKGTPGAEVVPELAPQPQDYIVRKRRYSAFYGTELEILLRELDVDTVVLTGTVTNICVYGTAADAEMRGLAIRVPKECVAGFDPAEHAMALSWMEHLFGAQLV